jgi:serine/threonine-protein kinase
LRHLRLTFRIRFRPSTTVPTGDVIGTVPSGRVRVGTPVSLIVSSGPPTVVVPNVSFDPLSRAKGALVRIGLLISGIITQKSVTMPPGDVIGTVPAAGTVVKKGSSVQVILSGG